jgi:HSP20 family molecular chaperone IbpA
MATRNIPVTRGERTITGREETRNMESYIRPAVDIFETDEGLTLMADLPGVAKEGLDVGIEKGILTIKGSVTGETGGNDLYREFTLANFYRQFQLPDEIDPEKTRAELKNGVLTLNLQKAEAAKPRRIEITAH